MHVHILLLKRGCTAKFIASNSIALVASMETVIRRGHERMAYHMRGGHTNAVVRKTTTHLVSVTQDMKICSSYQNALIFLFLQMTWWYYLLLSVNLIQSKDLKFIRFA